MEVRICYQCGAPLGEDYVHLSDVAADGTDIAGFLCINCLDARRHPVNQEIDCEDSWDVYDEDDWDDDEDDWDDDEDDWDDDEDDWDDDDRSDASCGGRRCPDCLKKSDCNKW